MKKNLLCIFLPVMLVVGIPSPGVGQDPVNLAENFYMKLKGKINGNFAITMDLVRMGNELMGTYYYDKYRIPLVMEGNFTEPGRVELTEADDSLAVTGRFTGQFISNDTLSGTWMNLKTSEKLPFKLVRTREGVADLSIITYHKENCTQAEINRRKPANELVYFWDTICSSIILDLMKVDCGEKKSSSLINQAITAAVCGSMNGYFSSIDSLMNSVMKLQEGEFLDKIICCMPVMNENNILCFRVWQSEFSGGAHPVAVCDNYCFDCTTGKQITLDDILTEGFADRLNVIGGKIFVAKYGEEGWFFPPGQFELNNDFAITPAGLKFTWDQYEIGPYSSGMPEITIPFAEIRDLVKPQSVLDRVILRN